MSMKALEQNREGALRKQSPSDDQALCGRNRFTNQLRRLLQPHGWHLVTGTAPHTYEKT